MTWSSASAPNHTIALSTSELGIASRRAWLPSASHANSTPGSAPSRHRELEQPASERVDDDRIHRGDVDRRRRARRAARSPSDGGPGPRRRAPRRSGPARSAAQVERRSASARRRGRAPRPLRAPSRSRTRPGSGESRGRACRAARRSPSRSGRAGVGGRRHRRRHRRLAGQAGGDHARAQVAVGEDAQSAVAQVDDRRRTRAPRSSSRAASRIGVSGGTDDRFAADQGAHGLERRIEPGARR